MFEPLHQHFPEWYNSIEPEQQRFVRKILASTYYQEVAENLRQTLPAHPDQDIEVLEAIDRYVDHGTFQDVTGEYIAGLIRDNTSIQSFSDILVQLSELIQPTDGSKTDYNLEAAEEEKISVRAWRIKTYRDIAEDLTEVFPKESTTWAQEWQQARTLRQQSDLEDNIKQGARLTFDRRRLH